MKATPRIAAIFGPSGMRRRAASGTHIATAVAAVAGALLLTALFLAPSALAAKGVVGYIPFFEDRGVSGSNGNGSGPTYGGLPLVDDAAGEIENPAGLGVTGTGAGGASPGDIYVADNATGGGQQPPFFTPYQRGRLSQFSASGDFVRLWGQDVVASGPGQADESQTVTVDATAGSFNLSFHAPRAVGTGDVTVGSTLVSKVKTNKGTFVAGQEVEGPGIAQGTTIVNAGGGTLVLSNPATATESYDQDSVYLVATDPTTETTADLPYDIPASGGAGPTDSLENALNSLPGINAGGGSVTVTGGPGGSAAAPYLVTFDGGPLAGSDQRQLIAAAGASPLSGGEASAVIATTRPGATGFEVCQPDQGDVCRYAPADPGGPFELPLPQLPASGSGGTLINPSSVAVDESSGDVYVTSTGLINSYTATGQFQRAFGFDAVRSGPGDSAANSKQELVITADGGNFELMVRHPVNRFVASESATTTPIPYNAPAASVESALNALSTVGGLAPPGSVTVTGGPSGPGDSGPFSYVITFHGSLGGDDLEEIEADPSGLTFSSGLKSAEVNVLARGGALETCSPNDVCKRSYGGSGAAGDFYEPQIAIAPPTAPNAGDVLAAGSNRIQEFTPEGAFVRMFGWDVDATEPGTGFEVCTASSGNQCKAGTSGEGLGQISGARPAVAEDSTGAIYVSEESASRVQKFTPAGGLDLTPALFGTSEVQSVAVNAGAGSFRLGAVDPEGTTGTGFVKPESATITNVNTLTGAFTVGQPLKSDTNSLRYGTKIVAVGPGTLTVSPTPGPFFNATTFELTSTDVKVTADLPFDIPASGGSGPSGSLENALNALSPISGDGGSVSVSGGPGDAGGSAPYAITFDGGALARSDVPELIFSDGSTPLSGGSGAGANTVAVETTTPGGPRGLGTFSSPISIATGPGDSVFVARQYAAGHSPCFGGTANSREMRIQQFNSAGEVQETTLPCAGIPTPPDKGFRPVAVNPATSNPYLLQNGPDLQDGAYIFGEIGPPPALTLDSDPSVTPTGVTVSGTITPNGPGPATYPNLSVTKYRVEYKKSTDSDWTVYSPETSVGAGTTPVPFSVGVSDLTPNTSYDVRVVVTKPYGFAPVVDTYATLTTSAAAPRIDGFSSSHVTADSADLHALINPLGLATSYHFDYGRTRAYGQSTPEVGVGAGSVAEAVVDHISGLLPTVYHFRVVAHNAVGTTTSTDQTFNFYPEDCPNITARQQTGSGALPDCRAYELVSPANSGGSFLGPGGPSAPLADNPARFGFFGATSSIPGPWNPPTDDTDEYVATRTDSGWQVHYVGFPAEVTRSGRSSPTAMTRWKLVSNQRLDRFIEWGDIDRESAVAPFVWDANGASLGRFPTNLASVPGGAASAINGGPVGDFLPSADFSHVFFSSANVAFAPGGKTSAGGSVYDNDVAAGTVTIASKLPGSNADIPREPGNQSNDYIKLAGASTDGSHILMAAAGTGLCGLAVCQDPPGVCFTPEQEEGGGPRCGPPLLPSHLYMRVGGAVTYDVSDGHVVKYQAMTASGNKVFFTSNQAITADDHDTSADLYMWSEATDAVTRVADGAGSLGDTDACTASWISGCGVEIVPSSGGGVSTASNGQTGPSTDNSVAAGSGAVFFYSPEQFVAAKGIPGLRNLYVSRAGEIQHVATLASDKPITRIQVSPDGNRAAFITAARLTAYDNAGFREMYSYDAVTEDLRCVSCLPDGSPPTANVAGSENGIFMTDDGRTFFSTVDPLVNQDSNEGVDVYEYVSSRPQLITSGVSAAEEFYPTGLVGVSANGVNAYFSTLDTLVTGDLNGRVVKFYDARTGGGFPIASPTIPCAAADECHGPGNAVPPGGRVGSTTDLGGGGNAKPVGKHKAKRHHKKKRKHKHHKKRHQKQGSANSKKQG